MDEAAEAVNALYEGRRVNTARLDWMARVKFLRLQAAAAYAGYRLLYHVGKIRDAEFMQIVLSTVEDSDPLLDDALEYSLGKSVVGLASFLQAIALFCWYKAVEVRPFLALCPHLLRRLDEIEGYVEGVRPDSRLVHAEEMRLERAFIARMMPIDDYPR